MSKSADAFRTISEVAEWLGVQTHVLRFWESKFNQVRPVKRAGGRRYYRPADMLLLGGIRQLLHVDGLTVKGVQKLLREEGVAYVVAKSKPLDELTTAEIDANDGVAETKVPSTADANALESVAVDETPELALEPEASDDSLALDATRVDDVPDTQPALALALEGDPPDPTPEEIAEPAALDAVNDQFEDLPPAEPAALATPHPVDSNADLTAPEDAPAPMTEEPTEVSVAPDVESTPEPAPEAAMTPEPAADMEDGDAAPPPSMEEFAAEPTAEKALSPAGPTPNVIDAPDPPAIEDMPAMAGALSRLATRNVLSAEEKAAVAPLLKDLAALREKMAAAG